MVEKLPNSIAVDRTTEFLRYLGPHERQLLTFILALVPSWADAEDILQEVRTRLWEQFDQFDRSKDFHVWARSIAYWQVLTWRKTNQRRSAELSQAAVEAISQAAFASPAEDEERASALSQCLRKLDPARRQLIELYYAGGKSARELADDLGRSFHSVRHTLQRTRLALAHCIERSLKEKHR